MEKEYYLVGLFLLVTVLFSACANQGVPSGGPKDVTPPSVLGTYPANQTVNFKNDKIILQLDEFANLTNPFERVVSSPPLDNLEYNTKGKRIEISINDALRRNTTYVISFNNAIEDVTERNKVSNFQYVFSTGAYIDSLAISGKVIESFTKESVKEVLVMLYEEGKDSAFYKEKPLYFGKTDASGSFNINFIKPGSYQLVALEDQNFSYTYDVPSERLAFAKNTVVIDTIGNEPFELMLYQEEDRRQALKSTSTDQPGIIQFIYKQPIEEFNLSFLGSDTLVPLTDTLIRYSVNNDSVLLYYTKSFKRDIRVTVSPGKGIIDTVYLLDLQTSTDELPPFKAILQPGGGKLDLQGEFQLVVNQPLKSINQRLIHVFADSFQTKEAVVKRQTEKPLNPLIISHKWREDTRYDVLVLPNALTDNLGRTNDTIYSSVVTKRKEDYGFLTLILNGLVTDSYYILELVNDQDKVVSKHTGTGKKLQTTSHPSLVQEKLGVRIISDTNNNGKWDPGNYAEKRSPESVFIGNESIDIRANWESEIEINITP